MNEGRQDKKAGCGVNRCGRGHRRTERAKKALMYMGHQKQPTLTRSRILSLEFIRFPNRASLHSCIQTYLNSAYVRLHTIKISLYFSNILQSSKKRCTKLRQNADCYKGGFRPSYRKYVIKRAIKYPTLGCKGKNLQAFYQKKNKKK